MFVRSRSPGLVDPRPAQRLKNLDVSIRYKSLNTNVPLWLKQGREGTVVMELKRLHAVAAACALAPLLPLHAVAANNVVANPICTDNTANFNPTLPPSINLPPGFTASVFVSGLNSTTCESAPWSRTAP